LLVISAQTDFTKEITDNIKLVKMSNPNRVYFDLNSAILTTKKEDITFSGGVVTHAVIAQNSVEPAIVRVVLTLDEKYNPDKINIYKLNNNLIIKYGDKEIAKEEYFQNTFREDRQSENDYYEYSSMTTQVITKREVPVSNPQNVNVNDKSLKDIQSAFASSNVPKDVTTAFSDVIVNQVKKDLKLNTRYYLNSITKTPNGLLLSGFGSVSVEKPLYLSEPARIVFDMPNTLTSREVRGKEYQINETETIKIGQFEANKARLVLKTNKPDKYLPIYSPDNETLLLADLEKYNVSSLSTIKANLMATYYSKNGKDHDVVLAFSAPVVYSVYRKADDFVLTIYNADKYNESGFINSLKGTNIEGLKLKTVGQLLKVSYKLTPSGTVKVYSGIDGRSIKITVNEPENQKKIVPTIPIFSSPKKRAGDKIIVIDPGHGGIDCGATRAGIKESDITLDVSQRLVAILREKGYKVYITRDDNSTLSLQDRVDFAEGKNEDIFISVHVNSSESTNPVGVETHYYHQESMSLARTVHSSFASAIHSPDRGLFKSKFYVINHTTSPAILIEIGFISNDEERNQLAGETRKQQTAQAIADGIQKYLQQYK